jgi:hypothetical protein
MLPSMLNQFQSMPFRQSYSSRPAFHAQPVPINAFQAIVFQQARLPHLVEDAGLNPLLKAIVGSRSGTKLGGIQRFLLATCAQHKENGVHTNAVGSARATPAKAVRVLVLRQEPLDFRPEIIGDAPLGR